MPSLGKRGWGGLMRDRIEFVYGVDSWDDAIMKILPSLNTADSPEVKQKEKELELAQNNAQQKVETDSAKQQEQQETAAQAKTGANIQGFKNPNNPSNPNEQPGAELDGKEIGKSWFSDNFGMTSGEMVGLLLKAEKKEMIEIITPLIHLERRSILKHFSGVNPNLVSELPLTDSDYETLNRNDTRFDIPFRRFIKSWSDSTDDEQRELAYSEWRSRIDKSERLSYREQTILGDASVLLAKNGILDSRGIVERGVLASTSELAGLIKSHGFLYDIYAVGKGSKSDKKSLYYDVERGDAIVKDYGRLIAGLWEAGGKTELDPRGTPRIILPFSSNNSESYVDTLKSVMGVSAVKAEGSSIVIEGNLAVKKACDSAFEHLNDKKEDAIVIQKAIEGEEQAIRLFTYNHSSPQKQTILLKKWNISEEQLKADVI